MCNVTAARNGLSEIARLYGNRDIQMGTDNEYIAKIKMLNVTVGAKPHDDGSVECRIAKKCGDFFATAQPHDRRVFQVLKGLIG